VFFATKKSIEHFLKKLQTVRNRVKTVPNDGYEQGDQMSLWKKTPKMLPNPFFAKIYV
jgi:hypothetical protein